MTVDSVLEEVREQLRENLGPKYMHGEKLYLRLVAIVLEARIQELVYCTKFVDDVDYSKLFYRIKVLRAAKDDSASVGDLIETPHFPSPFPFRSARGTQDE